MGYSVEEFFHAADATCRLTGMESAGTVTTYGVSYQSRTDEPALRQIRQKAAEHAERVAKLVESL